MLDRMLAPPGQAAARRTGGRWQRRRRGEVTMFRARSSRLHLIGCSPRIAPPPADLRAKHPLHGRLGRPAPPAPLPSDVETVSCARPPPMVVTFGSMAAPRSSCPGLRRRLRRPRRRPSGRAAGRSASWTATMSLSVATVDHRALFPRAAAVIHHGGAGTTHAAVAAGVPSVVIPHVGDQPYLGRCDCIGSVSRRRRWTVKAVTVRRRARAVVLATAEPIRAGSRALGREVARGRVAGRRRADRGRVEDAGSQGSMASPAGFEPATGRLEGGCSGPLSYGDAKRARS